MVWVSFTVTGSGAAPTGSVSVTDGVSTCSASIATGKCQIGFTTAGDKTLTASYAGDANYNGGTASATHRVLYASATAIVTVAPSASAPGQPVMVTFAVTPAQQGAPAPSGNVTVSDGVNACTGAAAAGSCSITLTTPGTRMLTANYPGDTAYLGSQSPATPHVVATADLTIAKTHAGSFVPGQQGATYTITVTNSGAAPSSGTVSVVDNVPSGLSAVAIGGAGWSCAQPAGPCTRGDALAQGSS
jgi:uncharacterized repeat protein (TIGR01451 family)